MRLSGQSLAFQHCVVIENSERVTTTVQKCLHRSFNLHTMWVIHDNILQKLMDYLKFNKLKSTVRINDIFESFCLSPTGYQSLDVHPRIDNYSNEQDERLLGQAPCPVRHTIQPLLLNGSLVSVLVWHKCNCSLQI